MTRLRAEWIVDIEENILECQDYLKEKSGLDFPALAAKVSGYPLSSLENSAAEIKVAVVPITTGLGIITSFSESVASVIRIMGFEAFVTEKTDVDGIYEAYQSKADILYMADDDRFIALNLCKNKIIDNNYATATGYVTVLEGIAKGLEGKTILLLGYGLVGKEIYQCLLKKGADVVVYDKLGWKLDKLQKEGVKIIRCQEEIAEFPLIIDATSEGAWINKEMLHKDAWIVAPGIPFSLDQEAEVDLKGRIIHDYLQIGAAAMLGLAI